MSIFPLGRSPSKPAMAEAVVVGGLLTTDYLQPLYGPLLHGNGPSGLSSKERFIPVPYSMIGHPDEVWGVMEEKLLATHERVGAPIALIGHSIGGLIISRFGAEHPDKTAAVVCLAGAQEGIKQDTPFSRALARLVGHTAAREALDHDSDHMTEHRERIVRQWDPRVPLHLISPTMDELLIPPQGLGIELPEGQQPHRRVMGVPGYDAIYRRLFNAPGDTKLLPSLPTMHIDIALNLATIRYVRDVRRQTDPTVAVRPFFETPAPALAAA